MRMRRVRDRLSYANVMSTLAVFMVLAGGTAVAAQQLGKNSVGPRQLKKSSVTAAKLKKNAVTTPKIRNKAVTAAKLRDGAVTAAKIADGAIGGAKIATAATPFGRVVHTARTGAHLEIQSKAEAVTYGLEGDAYVQEADRTDLYMGAVDFTFHASCEAPRSLAAAVFVDPDGPGGLDWSRVSLGRFGEDTNTGTVARRVNIGPYVAGLRFRPGQATSRKIVLKVTGECAGGTSGITATGAAVDVIGIK